MIILRLLLLLTNLHLKLLSTQGTGADKLLSTQRVKINKNLKFYFLRHVDPFVRMLHVWNTPLSVKICVSLSY